MKIYTLTQLGRRLARSTSNPDTVNWKIVHYLDGAGHSTPDQMASYTGLEGGEIASSLAMLRRRKIVQEVSGGSF